MGFTHLHVHTEYSLLDGAARISDLLDRAEELQMEALAITDHGVLFGAIDFYREAKRRGIKPIIGSEVYTAARTMTDKDSDKDKQQGHLVLLAKNMEGYKNLMKIVSKGFTDGFYYRPRIDKDVLRKHSEGIIALSACLAGDIQTKLLRNDYAGAKQEALSLLEIFGYGNFYLELQDQGLPEEYRILPMMKQLHEETGIPFVATNDVHYVKREDAAAHDILLCVQTAKNVDDEGRMRFPNDQFYLKTAEEMSLLFSAIPEAIENTSKIADECNLDFTFGELHLPEFLPPEGKQNKTYLRELCYRGLENRYETTSKELWDRMEYELGVIENMDYVEYFLIVWDFIRFAKENGIMVGPGRGSAAGSLVAYCLQITDIDPIKYGLIFERFLNPDRISMPDIDIDFCYERRGEVIDYVIEKYGEDKVAQIITFGTMKAKQAIRDVGRAMNMSYSEVDAIAKMVPFDLKMTLDRALEMNLDLRQAYDSNREVKSLLDTAKALEGMPRHASTHAAGVVITKENMVEYVPLYLTEKGISTQYTMGTIEELGLLKMDFLGLRNLTVIRDALEMIKQNHGVDIDFSKSGYDDPSVYELISAGNTLGVFQLESSGMRQFMKNLRPDSFEDVVAGISLYRPGPMASIPTYIENKKNHNSIRYIHDTLKPILSVTYGCMVYQEQVMQIVRDLAGYTYGRSDLVRRAMSKKKRDVMEMEKEYFIHGKQDDEGNLEIKGCIRNGIPKKAAEEIYNQMVSFAEYAFNKSHAAAYAVIAYETAYLKTQYPVEFMAALLGSVIGDGDQTAKYIRNCEEMGIKVLPPDILESEMKFAVKDGAIRFGLLGVKNVGAGVVEAIIKMREQKPLPCDIFQFVQLIEIGEINKKGLESLIKAGALDCLGGNRAQYMAIFERLLESAQNDAKKTLDGQLSLFKEHDEAMRSCANGSILPDIADFSKNLRISMEKEMLGVYVTGHPLDDYAKQIRELASTNTEELSHTEDNNLVHDGMSVTLAGIITNVKNLVTKKNNRMAFLQLEDLHGSIEVIVFPNIYERYRDIIKEDSVVVIRGTVNCKEDEAAKVLADWIQFLETHTENHGASTGRGDIVKLRIPNDKDPEMAIAEIKTVLAKHPGDTPVRIYIGDSGKCLRAETSLWVRVSTEFREEIERVIGSENIK